MENIRLPIALVIAMAVQLAGGVWWVSQQAATISDLEETVSQLGSRMAIEDNVNLKRDVQSNVDEVEALWADVNSIADQLSAINRIKQRLALVENDLKYMMRDHDGMFTGPMKRDMK